MTAVWIAVYAMLGTGAVLAVVRVGLGPSLLDRVVAVETLIAIISAGIAAYAALARDLTVVPALVVFALLGFLGAVAVARYVGGVPMRREDEVPARGGEER